MIARKELEFDNCVVCPEGGDDGDAWAASEYLNAWDDYGYGYYDDCWSRMWTPYGPQWANVCGGYGYY